MQRNTDGFSLVELAVVLGVIGVIIGGIWWQSSTAYERARREQFNEQLMDITKNIRAYGLGVASVSGVFTTLMPVLTQNGVIPGDLVRAHNLAGGIVDSPWGVTGGAGPSQAAGSLAVCAWDTTANACTASASEFFTVELRGLKVESCTAVAAWNSSSAGPVGLIDVFINGTSMKTAGGALPILFKNAESYCAGAGNNGVTVDFVYRLRPPAQ